MWYVIQVCAGTEEQIRLLCEKRIPPEIMERCFVPYYERMRRYHGQWNKERKKLLPGYVFLVSEQAEALFFSLKHVPGLTKLIGTGNEIVPLSNAEITLLRRLGNDTELVEMSEGIIKGDKTIIIDGPLMGMEGFIKRIDRHKRVAYLEIEMMGRLVETQVGLEIVTKNG